MNLLVGRNCCGHRAECMFPKLITKELPIPQASLQCDVSLASLIMESVSPPLESGMTLVPAGPIKYSRSDFMKLSSLDLKKSTV